MKPSLINLYQRRQLLRALGALPAVALAGGLTACSNGRITAPATVTDRRVPVNADVSLHVRDWQAQGQSTASQIIVLLAGLGANAHCFDSLAPALAHRAGSRVLAVSRRGYGQSDKPMPSATQNYAPETLVADLIALFDALNIDRAVLAGHSIAGNEITLFAGLHPQRVRGLVYLDTTFDYTQPAVWNGEPIPDNPALEEPEPTPANRASMAAAIAFAKRINKNWWPEMETHLRDSLELLPDGSVRPNTPVEVQTAMATEGYMFSPDYTAVRAPALVVTVDPTELCDLFPWLLSPPANAQTLADARTLQRIFRQIRAQDADRLAAALPGCQRLTIGNAHHSDFFIEYQTEVVNAIASTRWS